MIFSATDASLSRRRMTPTAAQDCRERRADGEELVEIRDRLHNPVCARMKNMMLDRGVGARRRLVTGKAAVLRAHIAVTG